MDPFDSINSEMSMCGFLFLKEQSLGRRSAGFAEGRRPEACFARPLKRYFIRFSTKPIVSDSLFLDLSTYEYE